MPYITVESGVLFVIFTKLPCGKYGVKRRIPV